MIYRLEIRSLYLLNISFFYDIYLFKKKTIRVRKCVCLLRLNSYKAKRVQRRLSKLNDRIGNIMYTLRDGRNVSNIHQLFYYRSSNVSVTHSARFLENESYIRVCRSRHSVREPIQLGVAGGQEPEIDAVSRDSIAELKKKGKREKEATLLAKGMIHGAHSRTRK